MMNNDYKNIIWGRHVWLTFTAPGTCCCNKEKTVFVTPPAPCLFFTDYPQYSAVIIGNHMIFFRAIWDKSALVNFSKTQPNCTSPGTGNVMGQSLDNFNATPRLDKKKQFQLKVSFGSGLVSPPPHPTFNKTTLDAPLLRFSLLLNNQHVQIPIRCRRCFQLVGDI